MIIQLFVPTFTWNCLRNSNRTPSLAEHGTEVPIGMLVLCGLLQFGSAGLICDIGPAPSFFSPAFGDRDLARAVEGSAPLRSVSQLVQLFVICLRAPLYLVVRRLPRYIPEPPNGPACQGESLCRYHAAFCPRLSALSQVMAPHDFDYFGEGEIHRDFRQATSWHSFNRTSRRSPLVPCQWDGNRTLGTHRAHDAEPHCAAIPRPVQELSSRFDHVRRPVDERRRWDNSGEILRAGTSLGRDCEVSCRAKRKSRQEPIAHVSLKEKARTRNQTSANRRAS